MPKVQMPDGQTLELDPAELTFLAERGQQNGQAGVLGYTPDQYAVAVAVGARSPQYRAAGAWPPPTMGLMKQLATVHGMVPAADAAASAAAANTTAPTSASVPAAASTPAPGVLESLFASQQEPGPGSGPMPPMAGTGAGGGGAGMRPRQFTPQQMAGLLPASPFLRPPGGGR